ncbi:hypothetical protein AC578_7303 [Pseudocercospora eumusae]|uniref:Uncharacterized protein n=1 Tax=Pseudocercospora eumusae TaxID=321146 RepID=A0A139HWY8_9PEZI|nr:hypothetical protein AC578_7303 [Pseudocercospora eumusae]
MDNTFLVYEDTTDTWSFSDEQGNSWRWRGEDQEVLANSSVRDWLRILFDSINNPSGPLIFDATRQEWRWETYARVRTVPRSRELLILLDECVILHLRTSFQAKSSQSAIAEPNNDFNHADLFDFTAPAPAPAPAPLHQADASMADDPFQDGTFRDQNTQSYQASGNGAAFSTLNPSSTLASNVVPLNTNNTDLFDFGAPAPSPSHQLDVFMADDLFQDGAFRDQNTPSHQASRDGAAFSTSQSSVVPLNTNHTDLFHFGAPAPAQDTSMLDCVEDDDPFSNKGTLSPAAFSSPLPAPRILGSKHTPSKTSTNSFNRRGIDSPTTPIIDDHDMLPSSASSPDRIDTPCPTGKKTLRKLLDARRPGRKDRAQNGFEFVNVSASCFAAMT